jgi:hypothetical protein
MAQLPQMNLGCSTDTEMHRHGDLSYRGMPLTPENCFTTLGTPDDEWEA